MLLHKPFPCKRNMGDAFTFVPMHPLPSWKESCTFICDIQQYAPHNYSIVWVLMHEGTVEHSCFDQTLITRKPDIPRIQQALGDGLHLYGSCKISKSLQENQTHAQGFDSLFHQSTTKLCCNFQIYVLNPSAEMGREKSVIWGCLFHGLPILPRNKLCQEQKTLPSS